MKDCQRRWKPDRRNSAIDTLMGFDRLHPKKPFHEKRRGLSESYIRNAASIALRPGSLVPGRLGADNGVQSSSSEIDYAFVESRISSLRRGVRSSETAGFPVSDSLSRTNYDRRTSNYKQKLEHDLLRLGEIDNGSMRKSLNSHVEMIEGTRLFSASTSNFIPNSKKLVSDLKDDEFDAHFNPGYREQQSCIACSRAMDRISQQERCRSKFEEVLRYENYSHQSSSANQSKKQNLKRYKMAKGVQGFGVSGGNQTLNQILSSVSRISKLSNLDMKPGLCSPTSLLTRSSSSRSIDVGDDEIPKMLSVSELEAMLLGLSKIGAAPVSAGHDTDADTQTLQNKTTVERLVEGTISTLTGWNLTQNESFATENQSKEQRTFKNDNLGYKSGKGSEQFQISLGVEEIMSPGSRVSEVSCCSFSCFDSALNNPEAYILGNRDEMDSVFENDCGKDDEDDELHGTVDVFSRTSGDPESELKEEGGKFSAVEEVLTPETSLNEYFKEESAYSNFSSIVPPESQKNLKRTDQHSPDSVLESFDIKSSYECFDSTGLLLQLESLNFDSGETYSEGSVMAISGNEDAEEEFGIPYEDSIKVSRWLGDGQNRNFSYAVDVLDEAGFCDMNSYMDFKMWYSLECPINPSVFEALEKKYGKQTSWQKSERRLLFDRINSWLLDIFNPITNVLSGTTYLHRRICDSFRLDEVVDELWTKLVSQEKEKSKELSLDKWLELEEGSDIICRELEASLLDELVVELASSWD